MPTKESPQVKLKNVLILDDDSQYGEMVKRLLEITSICGDSTVVADGYNALRFLIECDKAGKFPELIVVDIRLAGLDGFEFLELYKDRYHKKHPKTHLVINTAHVSLENKTKAARFGFVKLFVAKPLTDEHLPLIFGE